MILTSASTHTGGGLWDVGAKVAGLTPVWGIEYRADIAAVARKNIPGFCVIVSDVASVIYSALQRVYHLHSSPSCKNASGANSKGEEAIEDIESALAICAALRALEPVVFTLENVTQYRGFMSFRLILACLSELGYCVKYWVLNSADYGVPQTRKRLILIARRDKEPVKPMATHYKPDAKKAVMGMRSMFWQPWNGWYQAIEDLIPSLPETELAPWQLARMPEEYRTMLLAQGSYDGEVVNRAEEEPAFTITANSNQGGLRAFIMPGGGNTNFAEAYPGRGVRYEDEPAQTVTTVTQAGGSLPRAFLLNKSADKYGDGVADSERRAFTVVASSQGRYKAFIVDGQNACGNTGAPTIRRDSEPMFTVTNQGKGFSRAVVGGRWVSITPRCLARFQSVPDSYELPEANGLACEVVGNGVPCLLAKAICESLI